jgi:tRNA threonylcarbamoyl adenosine modification protein YeaZ
MPKQHDKALGAAVDQVFHEAGLKHAQVDAVFVGQGPGSFIGVRLALAFAKGFCLALNKPLIGICSLEAVAHSAQCPDPTKIIWSVIDARKSEVYLKQQGTADDAIRTLSYEALAVFASPERWFIGTLDAPCVNTVVPGPSAEALWLVSRANCLKSNGINTLTPNYIRMPDIG